MTPGSLTIEISPTQTLLKVHSLYSWCIHTSGLLTLYSCWTYILLCVFPHFTQDCSSNLLWVLLTLYSGFTLSLGLLTLFSRFAHILFQVYSHFVFTDTCTGITHTGFLSGFYSHSTPGLLILQAYSKFTLGLLTLYSCFFSPCTKVLLTLVLLRVYSHFRQHLLTLFSGFTHTLVWFLSQLTPCLPTFYSGSTHTSLLVYTHFTTHLLLLYTGCTHALLQGLPTLPSRFNLYYGFYYHFTLSLLTLFSCRYSPFTPGLINCRK